MTIKITFDEKHSEAPVLWERYQGQSSAQPVYLSLDSDGSVGIYVGGEISNEVPMDVFYDVRFVAAAG